MNADSPNNLKKTQKTKFTASLKTAAAPRAGTSRVWSGFKELDTSPPSCNGSRVLGDIIRQRHLSHNHLVFFLNSQLQIITTNALFHSRTTPNTCQFEHTPLTLNQPWRTVYLHDVMRCLYFHLARDHHNCVPPGTIEEHDDIYPFVAKCRDCKSVASSTPTTEAF